MRKFRRPYGAATLIVHLAGMLVLLAASPASAAEKLVVAFGDSLSAGYNLPPAAGFAPQLERALRGGGVPARVHNAGVSGDTSAGGRARLGWVLNALGARPDLVIVELGANDMLRGLKPADTRANLDAILAELRRRHVPVLIAGMAAAPNMGKAYRAEFDAVYPAIARRYGVPLYPFFLRGVAGNRTLQLPDGMHPNARGVAVMVRGIVPAVKPALMQPRRPESAGR